MREFPEVDRAEWFDFKTAEEKIIEAQREFLSELKTMLKID